MLISSLLEPKTANIGDYWYCLADKSLSQYISAFLIGQWMAVNPGKFVSHNAPTIQTSNGLPSDPIWIDATDIHRIPRIWDPSGSWVPVIASTFQFPPQSPNPGDVWFDTNVMCGYSFGNNGKWNMITVAGQSSLVNPNFGLPVPVGSPGINAPSPPLQLTNTSSKALMSISQSALKITGLVEIYMDGRIVYDPSYTPDAAAKALWEAIAHFSPVYQEGQEVQRLRHDIDDYKMIIKAFEDAGFELPTKKGPADPNAAWNAAMGVII